MTASAVLEELSCAGYWDSCFDPIFSGFIIASADHTAVLSSPRVDADDNRFAYGERGFRFSSH